MQATNRVLGHLVRDVIDDFGRPDALLQLAVLAGCLLAGWLLSLAWQRALAPRLAARPVSVRYAYLNLTRAAFSLIAAGGVWGSLQWLAAALPVNVLRLALVPLSGIGAMYLGFYVIRRAFGSAKSHTLVLVCEKSLSALVWLGMAAYVFGVFGDVLGWLDSIHIGTGRQALSLLDITHATLWTLVSVAVALWLSAWLEERLMRATTLEINLKVVLARLARAVFVVVAILVSLSLAGIDLTVLSVFGGALGVGLGFGLQKIASNYVSGFIILLDHSLRIGDMISVADNYGTVTQIRTRYTVIRSADGVEALVPNELLVSGVVHNHSLTESHVRLKLRIQAGYRHDPEQVIALLNAAAAKTPRVLAEPAPAALLVRFADSGIEYELGFWIDDANNGRMNVESNVNLAIWRAFAAHGIEIPYPQHEVRLLRPSQQV